MPRPFPAGFRRDVVAVARKHEAPDLADRQRLWDFRSDPAQLAKESRHRGRRPSRCDGEGSRRVTGCQEADPVAGAGERDPAPGSGVLRPGVAPKMRFPLVLDQDVRRDSRRGGLPGAGFLQTGLLRMEGCAGHGARLV
jgi:hypothetical protein